MTAQPILSRPSRHAKAGSPKEALSLALKATFAVLLPFTLALLGGTAVWLHQTWESAGMIGEVAEKVAWVKWQGQGKLATYQVVDTIEQDWDGTKVRPDSLGDRTGLLRRLAISIETPKAAPRGFAAAFAEQAFKELTARVVLPIMAVQSILILFFPALFISTYFFAAGCIVRAREIADSALSFADAISLKRYRRFLEAEAHWRFWRRLGFAILLGVGVTGLFSPAGQTASLMGEYVALHPMPGEPSMPFFLQYFRNAPPYVVGFAGFYLYALTTVLKRYQSRSLNQSMMVSLLNRGIVVVLLSLVISGVTQGDSISRALIFVVGIFPQTGLQFLSKLSQSTVNQLLDDSSAGFRALPEIDIWIETALAEVGIFSIHDLAVTDWEDLLGTVSTNPSLLLRAADRSVLLSLFGPDRTAKLESIPLYTASELVEYLTAADHADRRPLVETLLEVKDLSPQVERLRASRNICFVIESKRLYGSV
jgi:hypothetical protein